MGLPAAFKLHTVLAMGHIIIAIESPTSPREECHDASR
jgi:hypothetical protein